MVADNLDGWLSPESLRHNGLVVKRCREQVAVDQKWVDEAARRQAFGKSEGLEADEISLRELTIWSAVKSQL